MRRELTAGVPSDYASALVELIACHRPGRLPEPGQRVWSGTTRLEDILPQLLAEAEVRP